MKCPLKLTLTLLVFSSASMSELAVAADMPFDGRWSVLLVCPDTKDKSGLVKGTSTTSPPRYVTGPCQVSNDGVLEIQATGNTGRSDYSVGKVAQGTQYNYTLQGRLEQSRGQATRRKLRPCTATFSKL